MAALTLVMMLVLVCIYFLVNLKNAQIVAEEREKEMTIVNVKTAESEMAEKNK